MNAVSPQVLLPAPRVVHVDVINPDDFHAKQGLPFHMVLPHEQFAALYSNYKEGWKSSILPSPAQAQNFWRKAKHLPQFKEHPLLKIPDFEQILVPIALHGDETPICGKGTHFCIVIGVLEKRIEKYYFVDFVRVCVRVCVRGKT